MFCVYIDSIFISGILTMIIVRTLRRDIAKYNKMDEEVVIASYLLYSQWILQFNAQKS